MPTPPASCAELPVVERQGNFREVESGYDEHTAREEAKRCLRCDWMVGCHEDPETSRDELGMMREV